MASSTTQQQQHSNPRVAKVLAFASTKEGAGVQYPSAAALCRAAAEHYNDASLGTVATGRAVRQVRRDMGEGVGRGHTYGQRDNGKVAQATVRASKALAKRQASAAKQASKAPPAKQATPAS